MSLADGFALSTHFLPLTPPPRASAIDGRPEGDSPREATRPAAASGRPVRRHRLAEVRERQGVSVRSAARRMGVPMDQVRREELPDTDLTLSQLARWERALEVPLVDLLIDNDEPLSAPVLKRAKWLRLMKTVKALAELKASPAVSRMAEMLEQQVLDVMPELKEVGAWHSVGQRRTQEEMGRIVDAPVPTTFARDGLR